MSIGLFDIADMPDRARVYQTLFDLLAERDPIANISHRQMPTFEQHKRFVSEYLRSGPQSYRRWFLIMPMTGSTVDPVYGAAYVTLRHEIGIQIAKEYQRKGIATEALELLIGISGKRPLFANIAPGNAASIALFAKFGFTHIQNTFERLPDGQAG